MELLQLKYFCAAAESENFSKTAQRFMVPTSNISQSIKRLEKELGAPLFTRSANRVVLNDRGGLFYNEIKHALTLIEKAKTNTVKSVAYTFKMGIFANRRIAMKAVEKFQKLYPDISIIVSHESTPEDTDFDIIISDGAKKISGLTSEKFYEEKIVLAAPKGYFKTKSITANDIKDKPFITMASGWSLYNITQKICSDMGFTPRIALQGDDPFYVRKCIEIGLGISFVSEFSWRGQFSPDIELINIGDYKRDIYIHRRKSHSPPYVDKFYAILLKQYDEESNK